jgi:AhpD family alkylhydroperoxidase
MVQTVTQDTRTERRHTPAATDARNTDGAHATATGAQNPDRAHPTGSPTATAAVSIEPRMTQPALLIPEAMRALVALAAATKEAGLPPRIALLVHLRASQINGCSWCVDMHSREMRETGEPDERIFAVAAWRESPYFDDGERAALALTEALTRLSDRAEPVPDPIFDEAAAYFEERTLAALILDIAAINVWNRLNVATRQVAGSLRH